jgi:hypothetical protein
MGGSNTTSFIICNSLNKKLQPIIVVFDVKNFLCFFAIIIGLKRQQLLV